MLFEAPQGDVLIKGKTINVEATNALKVKGQTVDTDRRYQHERQGWHRHENHRHEYRGERHGRRQAQGRHHRRHRRRQAHLNGGGMTQVSGAMVQVG